MKFLPKKKFEYGPVLYFIRPYRLAVTILIGFALVKSLLELLNVTLIYEILKWGLQANSSTPYPILRWIEAFSSLFIKDPFIASCNLFILSTVLLGIMEILHVVYRTRLITRIIYGAQTDMYKYYLYERYATLLRTKQGELIYNMVMPPSNLQTLYTTAATLCTDAVIFIVLFGTIWFLSWKAAAAISLVGLAYHLFTHYVSGSILYTSSAAQQKADQKINVVLNETFNGIRTIKSSRREPLWIRRFSETVSWRLMNYQRRTIWKTVPTLLLSALPGLALGGAGILLRWSYKDSFYQLIPLFGAVGFALYRILPHISSLVSIKMDIVSVLPSLSIMSDALQSKPVPIPEGSRVFEGLKQSIVFDRVGFSHEGQRSLLSNFSLRLERGKTTALVGASGVGKSTIVNLLLRLFDLSEGQILVDGIPLSDFTLDGWLQKIGFVGQEPFVVHGTIRENILFGGPIDISQMEAAARLAGLHDFIQGLPQRYDTVVGDQGFRLSGGERQRLCIARALLRQPDILILDEATSSLDNISEAAIQKSLETIRAERTVLMIAHRLSTVVNADLILVMDHDGIAESGKHGELLARRGKYWDLYSAQTTLDPEIPLSLPGAGTKA